MLAAGTTIGGALILLCGSVVFTGAVEWLGRRLRLSHGAVGSTLAALGTALPEASIAVVALLPGPRANVGVGVGAILGAPLLLATLAPLVAGIAAWRLRGWGAPLLVDRAAVGEDVAFVLPALTLVGLAALTPVRGAQRALAAVLVLAYAAYLRTALGRAEGVEVGVRVGAGGGRGPSTRSGRPAGGGSLPPLKLWPSEVPPPLGAVLGQAAVGLGAMLAGAEVFVGGVEALARALGAGGFVLAVLIAPLATELPETLNSVLWLRQGKDTLALGNITGAMALQGTIIPALGILATPWQLGRPEAAALMVTLASVATLYVWQRRTGRWNAAQLVAGGIFYAAYLALAVR